MPIRVKTFLMLSTLDYLENTSKYSQLNSFSDNRKSSEWSTNFRPLCDKTLFIHSKAKWTKNIPKCNTKGNELKIGGHFYANCNYVGQRSDRTNISIHGVLSYHSLDLALD